MNRDHEISATETEGTLMSRDSSRETALLLESLASVSSAREVSPGKEIDKGFGAIQRALCKACADALDLKADDETPAFRISPFTRLSDDEIWVDRKGDPYEPPPEVENAAGTLGARVLSLDDGRFAAVVPVCLSVEDRAYLGQVLAIRYTEEEAIAFVPRLEALASVLAHALGLLRELTDRRAMIRLSEELSRVQDTGDVLERIAGLIKDHIQADGLKVFVLRGAADGEMLEVLFRTDLEQESPRRDPLDSERGLANWVVLHNDWALINDPVPGGEVGKVCEIARTGRHGNRVGILAIKEDDDEEKSEAAILIVPLRIGDQCVGALTVWRESRAPFDRRIDRVSLEALASQVAAGCRFRVQREYARRVTSAIADVTRLAAKAGPHREIHRAIAEQAGDLSGAEGVVLVMWDNDGGWIFPAGEWWRKPEKGSGCIFELSARKGRANGDVRETVERWIESIPEEGRPSLKDVVPLGDEIGSLVFLNRASTETGASRLSFDDENWKPAVKLFVEGVDPVLATHPAAFAFRVADEFAAATKSSDSEIDVLGKAAEVLREATGCAAVLVYSEDGNGRMALRRSAPESHPEELLETPIPLFEAVINTKKPLRILDVGSLPDRGNPGETTVLNRIAEAFGWSKVRSVLGHPVVVGNRCVGLITLLSDETSPFLGPCHEETVRGVAEGAARVMDTLRRREVLSRINEVADALAALKGGELAAAMAVELEGWCRSVIRPGLEVVVTASVDSEKPRVFSISQTLAEDAASIEASSADHRNEDFAMNLRRGCHVFGVPIGLRGVHSLWGHLCIVGKETLDKPDVIIDLQEGAREISILLDGERRRRNWYRQMGRSRHAVFGAAQGLVSASRETLRLAERHELTAEEIERLARRITAEAEAVRLWRENQRLYAGDGIQIRKRPTNLKDVVERVIRRWDDIAKDRSLAITLDWKTHGNLVFRFDEQGLDIALSNLLDNALKCSFAKKTVDVSVEIMEDSVRIVVEDFGHPIPERLGDAIFEEGKRMDWTDPARAITGSGLGLPMARRIIEAHGGTLIQRSFPKGLARDGKTERAVVRFVVELPFERRMS